MEEGLSGLISLLHKQWPTPPVVKKISNNVGCHNSIIPNLVTGCFLRAKFVLCFNDMNRFNLKYISSFIEKEKRKTTLDSQHLSFTHLFG